MLHGRAAEQRRVDALLAGAREARGGALVVRGEAGIGKTALLDDTAARASGFRVLRASGVEFEAELPFGGLHLLLHPFLDRLDGLPAPQAAALRGAFGLTDEPVRDRFLIGVATLTLLAELADEAPVLCLVDDAQWLDRASADALLFTARRLEVEPIAMVVAVRGAEDAFPAPGVENLPVTGLDLATAGALLAERAPRLAAPMRERVLREAAGNPLALVEFAGALDAALRSGQVVHGVPVGPLPAGGHVGEAFRRRITELPAATRLLLLVAAADDSGDLDVVEQAGAELGGHLPDLDPAVHSGLISVAGDVGGDSFAFRHPLVRAAAYTGAPREQRRAVHRALARVLARSPGDERGAHRRAWHLAAAASGPDEGVAAELERVARRAGDRGGPAAMAAALERAAELTADPARSARLLVDAARAAYDGGRVDWACDLAARAGSHPGPPGIAAEAAYVRAQVQFERASPAAGAVLELDGARPIVGSDPEQAVVMLTEAVWTAWVGGDEDLAGRAAAALAAVDLPAGSALRPVVGGMTGLVRLLEGDVASAVGPIGALVGAVRRGAVDSLTVQTISGFMALLVGDDDGAAAMSAALVAGLRERGALGWLPYAMEPLAIAQCLTGRFPDAAVTAAEGAALAAEIGQELQAVALDAATVWLAAVTGDDERCRALAGEVVRQADRHPAAAALASWGLGLLELAAGRSGAALEHLDRVHGEQLRRDHLLRAVPDWVEAAVRSDAAVRGERAAGAAPMVAGFADWARHTGQPAAQALALRCQALLATGGAGDRGDAVYEEALRLHAAAVRPFDTARTRLVYGEWLRRQRRRTEARDQLLVALRGFERLGATGWAARAAGELEVLGHRPAAQVHDPEPALRLTPQELQVVRLAAAGLSNREIGARLFLSPRTVGHHLYKAFPKIGVTRRVELAQLDLGSVT